MKLFITGGSGFTGSAVSSHFLNKGHHVTATGSSSAHKTLNHPLFTYICADTTVEGPWQNAIEASDVIINLAGRTIFKPWTKQYRTKLYESRILTTRNVVSAISANTQTVLLSTSAAGFYGDRGEEVLTENSPPSESFLSRICIDWEKEAITAEEKNARVIIMRFGTVLGKGGGAIEKTLPLFRLFAGGPLGNGKQWFPWIHMEDLIHAIEFLITNQNASGICNFCSPEPIRHHEFASELGALLNRPSIFPTPSFIIKLVMGDLGEALLSSQHVVPSRLQELGYRFKFKTIKEALSQIVT